MFGSSAHGDEGAVSMFVRICGYVFAFKIAVNFGLLSDNDDD